MKSQFVIVLASLLALASAATAAPSGPLTVAVYDFSDTGDATSYGSKVTALVTADLSTETNLIMVERSDLKKALGEQAIGLSGMVSSDTAAKIGAITGAKILVSGQVIKTEKGHLVIIANIIGTDTGRLFAAKVEGASENFVDLTSDLSKKIAQTIRDQAANFVTVNKTHEEFLNRLVKSVTGTNRPTVSVNIHWAKGGSSPCETANTEMGVILQKAGFVVVDGKSERKPDVEITALIEADSGPRRGNLFSWRAIIDAKVQNRRTGAIIAFDRQTTDAVDVGRLVARKAAEANVVDALAERIVPLLAK